MNERTLLKNVVLVVTCKLSLLQLATSPFLSLLLKLSLLYATIHSRFTVRWWEYALGMQVYVMQSKLTLNGQRGPFWTFRSHMELLLLYTGVDIYVRIEPFGEGSHSNGVKNLLIFFNKNVVHLILDLEKNQKKEQQTVGIEGSECISSLRSYIMVSFPRKKLQLNTLIIYSSLFKSSHYTT